MVYFYNKQNVNAEFDIVYKERDREPNWVNAVSPKENKEQNTIYIHGRKFISPKNHHLRFSQSKFDKLYSEKRIRIKEDYEYIDVFGEKQYGVPQYLESELTPTDSNWTDFSGYSFGWKFQTENSEILLKRVIKSTSKEDNLIIDFFLGSGTTTAVAHKLKRKWLGVEMGEHFYDVILPRMKKVLSYDQSGISKAKDVKEIYNSQNAGGFFKYYELEQYEDTLRKVKYEDSDLFNNPYEHPYNQYVFMRDSKMLEALEIDYKNNQVKVDLSKLYKNIDIPETLSNLYGKWIKKINSDFVEFEDGERIDIKNLDYKLIKSLIWW
ncbi:MAG: site-specific DNA-methyltransferase [Actinobacteria bacterium]|nr:site-specific DNA-methyltransferase [Actinomycetota bacterium]